MRAWRGTRGRERVIGSLTCGKGAASGAMGWGRAWLVSRSVIQGRRKRIRGHRALRPVVLCGAMLAPALLAGGLLVAELTGYGAAVRVAVAGGQAGEGVGGRAREGAGGRVGIEAGAGAGVEGRPGSGSGQGVGGRAGSGSGQGVGGRAGVGSHDEVMGPGGLKGQGASEGRRSSGTWGDAGLVGVPEAYGGTGPAGPLEAGMPVAVVPVVVGPAWVGRFEPRPVPPPLRPDRVYGGWMRAAGGPDGRRPANGVASVKDPVKDRVPGTVKDRVPGTEAVTEPWKGSSQGPRRESRGGAWRGSGEASPKVRRAVPRPSAGAPAPRLRRTPQPGSPAHRPGCPGEWRETWLWEVCAEHVRQEA
ncbi:hypothetical protein GCM10010517_73000 [Streptosporangium fragile]|uniref:Uncharacterized protein n=1 Tax=Streptosporangium fragile TaxID=46186 RepID=A0ABN3W8K0_9ACTN